jgi:hypothetical protein
MADLDKIMTALRNAHAAGDTKAATRLAAMAKAAKGAAAPAEENVIATTPDGGRVVKGADGALSFAGPAFSTNDPARIAEIMKGATPAEVSTSSFDRTTLAQNPAASVAAKFIQGVPFLGEYADEAIGATFGPDAMSAVRASNNAMDRERPKTAMGLQFAGGIVGAIPMAMAAAPFLGAMAPATAVGRVLGAAGFGAAAGGVEGAVSGYGAGEGDSRMSSAATRGAFGAGIGGLVGGLAPMVGAGARNVMERLRGRDVAAIAKTLNISEDAARVIKPSIEGLDFPAAMAALRKAGPDAMLADAGLSTRRALDYAITGGGKAARIGVDAVSDRAANAGARLGKVMDVILGVPKGVKAASRSIAERTAPARKRAYDLAYNTAIDYADDTGRNIEGVLARIEPETLSAAVKEANASMRAAGVKNKQIMAILDDAGEVSFKEMPNVQQLDEIKKGLDAIARAETDELTGKISGKGVRAKALAADLRTAIADAVPAYKSAVKLGGDKIATETAMDTGRKLFSPAMTRERVAEVMKGASVEAKDAARQGIREYVDDTLARVRRSYDDPDVDTKETLRLLQTLSSRDAREKLVTVLGDVKADRLLKEIDAAGKQFGTRQAVAAGSQTAQRTAMDGQMGEILAPGIVGNAAKGNVGPTLRSFVQLVTRATPEADMARKQAVLADMARALTEMRGPQAEAALKLVQKAVEGQPLKTAEALRIARLAGGATALGGYQAGQQYLGTRQGVQ